MPCLLLAEGGLVKTIQFDDPTYVGDPANVLSIFSDFEVDEIVLLDIRASLEGRGPDVDLLEKLADQSIIPMSYGGGISSAADAARVLEVGFEKVVLNTGTEATPKLVAEIAATYGSQAVVASVDARPDGNGGYEAFALSGSRPLGRSARDEARRAEDLGVGEVLLVAIHRDGTMEGYDVGLISDVSDAVTVPVVASGGAGHRRHLKDAIDAGASAVAAGSIFVFQGATRAVLINFPTRTQLARMFDAPEERISS